MDTMSTSPDALTIVVCEKPFVTRVMLPVMRKHPDIFPPGRTLVVHAHPHFALSFAFPAKTPWKDFPLVKDHVYRPLGPAAGLDGARRHFALRILADGKEEVDDADVTRAAQEAKELRLVCACDPDGTGTWMFARACATLLGTQGLPKAFDFRIVNCDDRSLASAAAAMRAGLTTADRLQDYRGKELQRRFEYNWWANAHALLRPAMARAGLPSDRALSKFEMQTAYFLAGKPAMGEGELMRRMDRWVGTGKYPIGQLGGPASRVQILANLTACGVVTAGPEVALTAAGSAFLASLPKDCLDADLAFRLAAWCASPAASQHKADAYLRKWFGKVKRGLPRNVEA